MVLLISLKYNKIYFVSIFEFFLFYLKIKCIFEVDRKKNEG